jgi:hypothetical protein
MLMEGGDLGSQLIEMHCSCDSILSRLIYGYSNYRKTMESLHPNLPAMGTN